jgi:hypothetical protein
MAYTLPTLRSKAEVDEAIQNTIDKVVVLRFGKSDDYTTMDLDDTVRANPKQENVLALVFECPRLSFRLRVPPTNLHCQKLYFYLFELSISALEGLFWGPTFFSLFVPSALHKIHIQCYIRAEL